MMHMANEIEQLRPMSKGEREDLARLVRLREKVLKSAAAQRSVQLIADFEQQLASVYSFDQDEIWKKAVRAARQAVDEAKDVIAARCKELGIPARFAPGLDLGWYGRGENAVREIRNELRRVATTRIAALQKEACVKIELHCLELQTQIIANGLGSPASAIFP
jgi:hypothetical protein